MKKMYCFILIISVFFTLQLFGQTHHSTYSGQEMREIKSLSQTQIEGYLSAKGMGFAKAAELNHYPGPKHVLGAAIELNLSDEQIKKTKDIYMEMHNTASKLGNLYIQKEAKLDNLFATKSTDETGLNSLLLEIGKIKSRIRFAHLKAHVQMKGVLSPEQIEKYDHLRGYTKQKNINHSQNNNN